MELTEVDIKRSILDTTIHESLTTTITKQQRKFMYWLETLKMSLDHQVPESNGHSLITIME